MSRVATPARRDHTAAPAQASVRAGLGALAAPALVGLALLLLLGLFPLPDRQFRLDVGSEGPLIAPDATATARHFLGFYAPEQADGDSFRWTDAWARLLVPNGHRLGSPLLLRLRACGCRPDGPQPTLGLALDNRALGELPTTGRYRVYSVLVPPGGGDLGSHLFIELFSPTANFDGRPVGARVDWLELSGARGPAVGWPLAAALALLGALAAALAARPDPPPCATTLILLAALLLGPLLVLAAYRRQELEPAALVLAALVGVLCVALARPRRPPAALGMAALAAALPLAPQLLGSWVVDDAFISFRYAQQLVAGNGLVFNPGERVEGYTNFLWTVLVAGMLRLGADPVYLTQIVTLLIAQATLALCFAVGLRLVPGDRREGAGLWSLLCLCAPLLAATNGPFLLYSARGSGLETALFGLLLLASAAAFLGGRLALCGALLALTTMTRPDGVVALAALGGCAVLAALPSRSWRGPLALAGAFLALFLPYYLWRYSYYGLPLPNTFYVKVGASTAQVERGLRYLAGYWQSAGWAWPLGLAALAGALLVRSAKGRQGTREPGNQEATEPGSRGLVAARALMSRWRRLAAPQGSSSPDAWLLTPGFCAGVLLLLALAYSAYITAVGGDWMPGWRFVAPLVPILALLAQAGLLRLAWLRWAGPPLAAALLALALADQLRASAATSAFDAGNEVWKENSVVARRREVGRWLRHNSPPDALVAVEAAGALPYYSQRPAIDILGLNDRHIASVEVSTIGQGKPGHEKTDIPYVLGRKPAIIPYFSVPYFAGYPEFEQGYARTEARGPEGYTVILYWRTSQ